MVQKYIYGTPIETEAVTADIPVSEGIPSYRPDSYTRQI